MPPSTQTWQCCGRLCEWLKSWASWLSCLGFGCYVQHPPRAGFFETDQFERVANALPSDLALVARIGYTLGWRLSSEVLALTRRQVDLAEGTLRLEPGMSKNREARVAYLTPELKAGIAEQLTRVKDLERRMGAVVPWLFPYLRGRHIGERIRSFRKRWAKACREASCPGMIRHDLRRTACRNMLRCGVRERTVMQVMGHRTRSMLDRYNIVSPEDLRDAAWRLSDKPHTIYPPQGIECPGSPHEQRRLEW